MKINKGYIVIGLIIAFTLIVELAAHADEFDHATVITFTQPVRIRGRYCQPEPICLNWGITVLKTMLFRYSVQTERFCTELF